MMLEIGAVVCGFLVQSVTSLPDVGGRMWRLTYEKNGAELVWLERPDEVKTFSIAFKTLPEDDTGVAHILEHAVLMGSEKYPVKSPFDELRKSSLRVFMNAMTAPDMTGYPVSTRNNQDLLNLTDVYLDAVFNPTAVKSPLALWQEGWRFELDPQTQELSYNGVVYNEMKGVFAEPERLASREVLHRLYPDIVYGHDSGGVPSEIPQLTFERFCAFYRKFYHPTNARIFLDGSVDIAPMLAKLDTYLSRYELAVPIAAIPLQAPVLRRTIVRYAASDCNRKTILADAWSVGTFEDPVRKVVLGALVEYLAGSNEAPIKRALLSRGLCDDLQLYCLDYQQLPLVMLVRNTTDEQAAECRSLVRRTVEELLASGLDRTRLRAIVDRDEFNEREVNTSVPRGLVFFSRSMQQWLYGGDPAAAFDLTGIYAKVRSGLETGLFERTLRESMLDNPHHVELTYSPCPQCAGEEERRLADELRRRREAMTPADLAALRQQLQELAEYQAHDDAKEDREKIPSLHLADLPPSVSIVGHTLTATNGMALIRTKPTCDGVVYLSAYFPIDDLAKGELVTVPLLAGLFGKLPTDRRSALELQTEIAARTGRLTFDAVATERGNYLSVKLAVLAGQETEAIELLKELVFGTRFDDCAAIGKILKQRQLAAERRVGTRGDDLAGAYSARGLARRWASRDILEGYEQLRWLQAAKVDERLGAQYRELVRRIFVRDGLVLSVTDNLPEGLVDRFVDLFAPSAEPVRGQAALQLPTGNLAGIRLEADTGYSGTAAMLPEGCEYTGAMRVASNILSADYLYNEIREKGGAYGMGIGIYPSRLILSYTYRDPSPVSSIRTVRGCGGALREILKTDVNLERYIVATVAGLDPYLPPADEAARPVGLYLGLRTPSDEQRVRRQVLATTTDDLAQVAEMLERQLPASRSLVVGGARQVGALDPARVEPVAPSR